MGVYCQNCGNPFPEYKVVGEAIQAQIPAIVGERVLTVGPKVLTAILLSGRIEEGIIEALKHYECVMDAPAMLKAATGSKRDACNAAQVPCPHCGRYWHWKRESEGKKNRRLAGGQKPAIEDR